MVKRPIKAKKAPGAIGPYSQAIQTGKLIFCSGQIPIDTATSELVGDDISAQTTKVLENIQEVLSAAGCTLANVVKATIFLIDLGDFATVNEVYAQFFSSPFPARSCIGVRELPKNAKIEIEVVAVADD